MKKGKKHKTKGLCGMNLWEIIQIWLKFYLMNTIVTTDHTCINQ